MSLSFEAFFFCIAFFENRFKVVKAAGYFAFPFTELKRFTDDHHQLIPLNSRGPVVLVALFHAMASLTATVLPPPTQFAVSAATPRSAHAAERRRQTAGGDGADDASAVAKCNQELTAYRCYGSRLKIRLSIPVQSRHARMPKQRFIIWAVAQSSKQSRCWRLLTA